MSRLLRLYDVVRDLRTGWCYKVLDLTEDAVYLLSLSATRDQYGNDPMPEWRRRHPQIEWDLVNGPSGGRVR